MTATTTNTDTRFAPDLARLCALASLLADQCDPLAFRCGVGRLELVDAIEDLRQAAERVAEFATD